MWKEDLKQLETITWFLLLALCLGCLWVFFLADGLDHFKHMFPDPFDPNLTRRR